MATVIHRNADSFKGIWLLDNNALQAFDEILDEEWNRLREITEQKIEQEINIQLEAQTPRGSKMPQDDTNLLALRSQLRTEIEKSYPFHRNSCLLTVHMASGQKFKVPNFKEIMADPAAQHELPAKFVLNMVSETIECNVEMEDKRISIRVSPEDAQEASTIFLKFAQWVQRFKSPKWFYWWREFKGMHAFLLILLLQLLLVFGGLSVTREQSITVEAQQLLKQGISQAEIPKALELILFSISGQASKITSVGITPWFKVFLAFSLGLLVIGFFPPNSRIGIGKGVESIQAQRLWLKIVAATVSTFMIMGVLASTFGSALYEFLK